MEAADHLAGGVEPLDRLAEDVEHAQVRVSTVRPQYVASTTVPEGWAKKGALLEGERLADGAGRGGAAEGIGFARERTAAL